jgi:hypothetical protein
MPAQLSAIAPSELIGDINRNSQSTVSPRLFLKPQLFLYPGGVLNRNHWAGFMLIQ